MIACFITISFARCSVGVWNLVTDIEGGM
jgi:hypothetical protein